MALDLPCEGLHFLDLIALIHPIMHQIPNLKFRVLSDCNTILNGVKSLPRETQFSPPPSHPFSHSPRRVMNSCLIMPNLIENLD